MSEPYDFCYVKHVLLSVLEVNSSFLGISFPFSGMHWTKQETYRATSQHLHRYTSHAMVHVDVCLPNNTKPAIRIFSKKTFSSEFFNLIHGISAPHSSSQSQLLTCFFQSQFPEFHKNIFLKQSWEFSELMSHYSKHHCKMFIIRFPFLSLCWGADCQYDTCT